MSPPSSSSAPRPQLQLLLLLLLVQGASGHEEKLCGNLEVLPGCTVSLVISKGDTSPPALQVTTTSPEDVWFGVGFHPHDAHPPPHGADIMKGAHALVASGTDAAGVYTMGSGSIGALDSTAASSFTSEKASGSRVLKWDVGMQVVQNMSVRSLLVIAACGGCKPGMNRTTTLGFHGEADAHAHLTLTTDCECLGKKEQECTVACKWNPLAKQCRKKVCSDRNETECGTDCSWNTTSKTCGDKSTESCTGKVEAECLHDGCWWDAAKHACAKDSCAGMAEGDCKGTCHWDHATHSCSRATSGSHGSEHCKEEEEGSAIDYWLISIVLLLSFAAVRGIEKLNWQGLSESGGIIIIGIVLGGVVELFEMAMGKEDEYSRQIRFDEETFAFFILPPIIFEAGYTLQHGGVMRNLGTILLYAVVGTLLSTFVIGFSVWGFSHSTFEELANHPGAPFICVAFGALLSAVDPVAVIAVLGQKFDLTKEPPLLYNLVFGESVLNDAVSIVLYNVMIKFVNIEMSFGQLMLALGTFIRVSLVSCVLGWTSGALCALFLKHINFRHDPPIEIIILLNFALGSYYAAEAFHLSGIMSLFICARMLGHHAWRNLSEYSQEATVYVFKTMARLAETYVFLLLGMAFWTLSHEWNLGFTALTFLAMLVARAINIFPLSLLANLNRKRTKVTFRMQFFMWFAGLRGAIAYGLALITLSKAENYRGDKPEDQITVGIAKVIVSTTLLLVVFTVLIMGGCTSKLLTCLGLIEDKSEETSDDKASPLLSPGESESPTAIPITFEENQEGTYQRPVAQSRSKAIMPRIARWESSVIAPLLRRHGANDHPEKSMGEVLVLGIHGLHPRDRAQCSDLLDQQAEPDDAPSPQPRKTAKKKGRKDASEGEEMQQTPRASSPVPSVVE